MWGADASSHDSLLSSLLLWLEPVRFPEFEEFLAVFTRHFGVAIQIGHSSLHINEESDFLHIFSVVLRIRRSPVDKLLNDIMPACFSVARLKMRLVLRSEADLGSKRDAERNT